MFIGFTNYRPRCLLLPMCRVRTDRLPERLVMRRRQRIFRSSRAPCRNQERDACWTFWAVFSCHYSMSKNIKKPQSAFEAHLKCFSIHMFSIECRVSHFSRLRQFNGQSGSMYLFAIPFAGVAGVIRAGFRWIFGNRIPLVSAEVADAMPARNAATMNHCCNSSFDIW